MMASSDNRHVVDFFASRLAMREVNQIKKAIPTVRAERIARGLFKKISDRELTVEDIEEHNRLFQAKQLAKEDMKCDPEVTKVSRMSKYITNVQKNAEELIITKLSAPIQERANELLASATVIATPK